MKTAGVRQLKDRLSEYLREVRHGETVLVTDRGVVVAELRPPGSDAVEITGEEQVHRQLLSEGILVQLATADPDEPWPEPPAQGALGTEEEYDALWQSLRQGKV